jgi:hypothetical protein
MIGSAVVNVREFRLDARNFSLFIFNLDNVFFDILSAFLSHGSVFAEVCERVLTEEMRAYPFLKHL